MAHETESVAVGEQAPNGRYRVLFELLPVPAFVVDPGDGEVLHVNEAMAELYGYSANEMIGLTAHEYSAEPERALRALREGSEPCLYARLHKRKDGSTFLVDLSVRWAEMNGHTVAFGSARPVVDRKLARSEVKESEELYRSLVEASQCLVWRCDAEGRLVFLNKAWETTHGYRLEEMLGRSFGEFQRPEIRARDESEFALHLGSAWATGYETAHVAKDGRDVRLLFSVVPVHDADGQVIGSQGTAVDTTERNRVDAYKECGREVLQIMNEPGTVPDLIRRVVALLKSRTGCDAVGIRLQEGEDFPFCDEQGFADSFLRTENSLLVRDEDGRVCRGPDGSARLACTCGFVIAGKPHPLLSPSGSFWTNDSFPLLTLSASKDPRFRPRNQCVHQGHASVALLPIRSRDRIVGLIQLNDQRKGAFSAERIELLERVALQIGDALARRRAEDERANLQEQLHQAQKMESVGRLAGGVAHDFNNMLGAILGYVKMAIDQVEPSNPIYADLLGIRTAAGRSAALTRRLLTFARKQPVTPHPLDLNEVIGGMLAMIERLIGEDIRLCWYPGAKLWRVMADMSQIEQILANLCINSRDAIGDVGTLTCETNNRTFDDSYCTQHSGFMAGEFVRVAVSDTGQGMDDETRTRLFEPFFTTKPIGQGTGLGLAIVYSSVQQCGGFIQVDSQVGGGTTFAIYLPRHVGAVERLGATSLDEAARGGHETILVVEDEPMVLHLTTRILRSAGYVVLSATTPHEALRAVADYSGDISLVLTDVVLPEMNGRDLARAVRLRRPDVSCVFVSGYVSHPAIEMGVSELEGRLIEKPFTSEDLLRCVREVLNARRVRMQAQAPALQAAGE